MSYSTEQATLQITDSFDMAIDNNKITNEMWFHSVDHNIVLSKLYAYGIHARGNL